MALLYNPKVLMDVAKINYYFVSALEYSAYNSNQEKGPELILETYFLYYTTHTYTHFLV